MRWCGAWFVCERGPAAARQRLLLCFAQQQVSVLHVYTNSLYRRVRFAWARSKLQSFTAPKSVMGDLPVEDASGEVRAPGTLRLRSLLPSTAAP